MRRGRFGGVVAGALGIVVSLTGCGAAQVGQSLVTEQIITAQLTKLVDEVQSVSTGVSAEYTNEITGSYTFVVDLQVTAGALTPASTMAIVEPVLAAFSSNPLAGQQLAFRVTTAGGGIFVLGLFNLTAATVSAEVDYWFGLSAALNTPLSIDLQPSEGANAPYLRAIAETSVQVPPSAADWEAARRVPDDSPALSSWTLTGISAFGTLPPARVTSLQLTLPDQNKPGAEIVMLAWDGIAGALSLSLFSEARGNRQFVVHLERCAVPPPAAPEIVNELADAGIILPPGAASGACLQQ